MVIPGLPWTPLSPRQTREGRGWTGPGPRPEAPPSPGARSGRSRSGGRGRCGQGAHSPCTGQAPGSACAGGGRPCSAFPSTQGGAGGADGSATLRRHRRPDGPQPALFLQAAPRSSFFIVIGQLGQKAQRANSPASRETPVRTDAFAGPATWSSGPTGVSLALALGGVQRAGGA